MKIGPYLRNHPRLLEKAYKSTHSLFEKFDPVIEKIGYERVNKWLKGPEEWSKKAIFDCRMCGQCILHSTGMTCPMSCPKNLRNGPCGGVRANGNCEVIPEMRCVWVEAFERTGKMGDYGHEILHIQPPVNRRLEGTSAWVNQLTGADKEVPEAWVGLNTIPVIPAGSTNVLDTSKL